MLLYKKMLVTFFDRGKEKGLEESDPKPYGKHNAECLKKPRQSIYVCI